MFEIKQAKREGAPITAALIGGTGTGKTFSALKMARGLVGADGKIVVIDTEGKRSMIYADDKEIGGFGHLDFAPPYSSARFNEAVADAVASGAQAIIIDSASHEHEGAGGMLDFAEQERAAAIRKKEASCKRFNQPFYADTYDPGFSIWVKPKMEHNRFVRFAVGCPAHVIFCIRLKTVNEMQEVPGEKNKKMVEVTKPVCEGQLLYEMTIAIELNKDHRARYIKVPEPYKAHIRDGEKITVDHGRLLLAEASRGAPPVVPWENQMRAINEAPDMPSLQAAFAVAYRTGNVERSVEKIADATRAKDARKIALDPPAAPQDDEYFAA